MKKQLKKDVRVKTGRICFITDFSYILLSTSK